MECSPDLSFLTMAAGVAANNEFAEFAKFASAANNHEIFPFAMRPSVMIKQRKTNFTPREVEVLLSAVDKRRDIVLFGTAGGQVWAKAWQEVAQEVTAVEGIYRTESDVRKKWTYLKWEAKNTSKPGRDPTSRAVLEILTGGDPDAAATIGAKSLLEELLVPGQTAGGTPQQASIQKQEMTNCTPQPAQIQMPIHIQRPITPSQPTGSGSGPTSPSTATATASLKKQPSPPSATPSAYTTEVCLRWNSYHSNMQTVFPSLLNNEQFVDVTLACEGQSIKCHKVMLSACSNYFEELLSQNPCQHPIVLMKDLRFWELQALVDFMYRGEVNVTQERLPSLLAAAEALQIKGLAGPASSNNTGNGSDSWSQDDAASPMLSKRYHRKRRAGRPLLPKTPLTTTHNISSPPIPAPSHLASPHNISISSPNLASVSAVKQRKIEIKTEKETWKEPEETKLSSAHDKETWKEPIYTTKTVIKSEPIDPSDSTDPNSNESKDFIPSLAESGKHSKKQGMNRTSSHESDDCDYENDNETECDTEVDENRSISSNGSANALMIDEGQVV